MKTEFGKICEQWPEGAEVCVTTPDGRSFMARSDGEGAAWSKGAAWCHPAVGVTESAVENSTSYGVAKKWS